MKKIIKRVEYKSNLNLHESYFLNSLLQSRGFSNKAEVQDFLNSSIDRLYDPFLFKDMKKAVYIINCAIKNNEKIIVFHDYDCDGVCAGYILSEAIAFLGGDVDCICPTREYGYGLNCEMLTSISKKYKLLITVDLGISNSTEVEYAKELGMNVIISDHHQLPNTLPSADAIVHPMIEPYPFKLLCGAGVAYKIAYALLGKKSNDYIDIVAIATVGDIVALKSENRILVKYGINKLINTENIGLQALLDIIGLSDKTKITSTDIAFKIVPRLNVAGRMQTADIALKLLKSKTSKEAEYYANILNDLNDDRKSLQDVIIKSAFNKLCNYDFGKNKLIVISGEEWNSGIIGLAAGKICEKYHLPVAVFAINDDKATASIRSIKGLNIYKLLKHCSDLFIKWGGHEQAAGLTMLTENIDKFSQMANEYISNNIDPLIFTPCNTYDEEITLNDVNLQNCNLLNQLEPFGEGNPEPLFLIKDAPIIFAKKVGADGNHLKMTFANQDNSVNSIAFGMGDKLDELYYSADLIAHLQKNTFNGNTSPQLNTLYIGNNKENQLKQINLIDNDLLTTYKIYWLSEALRINTSHYDAIESDQNNIEINDLYGTLIISYDKDNIIDFYNKYYEHFDIAKGVPDSLATLNTLLIFPNFNALKKYKYNRIFLIDNEIIQDQIDFLHSIFPDSEIYIKRNSIINSKNIYLGIEKFREIYIQILNNCYNSLEEFAKSLGENKEKLLFALYVFESLDFIHFDKEKFIIKINKNPKKCALEDSPLIKKVLNKVG